MATLSLHDPNNAPLSDAQPASGVDALLQGAGFARIDETGWLRVTGEDRVRWLNGMTTNSISALKAGEGCYNFFLSAQGRIQGDAYAFAGVDSILLETGRRQVAVLHELLDRFIIMDDVELVDASEDRHGLLCAGSAAEAVLREAGIETGTIELMHWISAQWKGSKLTVLRAYGPLVPRFEVWADDEATVSSVSDALGEAGAVACEPAAFEHLRVLEGTPLYGADIRDRELPQETGQTRALHFAKGCYLGQEIVERIRSRGNVHRAFQAFELRGILPGTGAVLESSGKPIGELTSVAAVPLGGSAVQMGLGFVRRELIDRGDKIVYPGGEALPVTSPYPVEHRRL